MMETLVNIGFHPVTLILSVIYLITILFLCLIIIFENRPPEKTLAWVLVILLIPVFGIGLYFFFGQSYRKKKIFSRKGVVDSEYLSRLAIEQIESLSSKLKEKSESIRSKSHLMTLMLNNERAMLTENNEVMLLQNANEAFPAMLEAINSAKDYIHLEFYRFDIDETGNMFRHLLIDKAKQGVEVRIIMDDVGSWSFKKKYIREMRRAGVRIYPFMPVRFPLLTNKINYRNHRKILVVDGERGFIGGLNIADKYLKGLKDIGPWRDTHLEIRGGAVGAMNRLFLVDWYFVSNEILTRDEKYLKQHQVKGNSWVQVASSGPDSDWANIMQVYFSSIATARKYIYLCTPYFSPNESILTALKTAGLEGLDVRIILPGKSDSVIGNWNTRSYISELLEAGVNIYLYYGGFNHSKYIIVDDVFSSVGSVNVDTRSFDLNFEVTALIYDEQFARKLHNVFMEDLKDCNEVLPDLWSGRLRSEKYKESLARILGLLY